MNTSVTTPKPQHDSDCSLHNMPAYPAGPCDCRLSGHVARDAEPIGGLRIVHVAFELHGYRQGTNECIAFNRGVRFAEREIAAINTPPLPGSGK